ncbi:sensor domain-containing diguanylate cyclase [Desulfamplus magnetovallimortis]|nr:sensor domain-containing diguanylate cyclase [Desulfamplus magnetovallimortis]
MQKRKIRLIIILTLMLSTGFLLTSLASYFVSRASLREEIMQNELPLTSDNIYSEIQRDLLQPVFISSLMASDTFLRDWVISGENDTKKIVRYLKEIKVRYGTVTSFFVSEKTGIYYQSGGILKTVSSDDERDKWYFRVRDMPSDYEINVDTDMANHDTMTIFINYRVYDYDGNYIGATGVGLTVYAVKQLIEKYQDKFERKIFFVDENGIIVLYGSGFSSDLKNISDIEGIAPLAMEILSTSGNSFHYKKDGHSFLLNTRHIPEFGWHLFVEQSETKALKGIVVTLFFNVIVCVLITSVVLFMIHLTISAYQQKLEEMATLDKLTGIYNRQAFSILFTEMIKEVHRRFIPFSVVMMDIDHFKLINDTHGHIAGDAVLRHLASVTRTVLRDSDLLCRWGGEEFILLLKECRLDDAVNLAEKIRKKVEDTRFSWLGTELVFTVSLGVSQWNLLDDREEDSIVSRADKALYMAKEQGRNRVVKRV